MVLSYYCFDSSTDMFTPMGFLKSFLKSRQVSSSGVFELKLLINLTAVLSVTPEGLLLLFTF